MPESNLTEPTFWVLMSTFLVKAKIYIYAILMAIFSSIVKYLQQKKNKETPSFKDFCRFTISASFVTLSALGVMQYVGFEINLLGYMIMFWLGISTDYIYSAVDKLIKNRANKYIDKNDK